ncbi:Protein affecting phage T7 exclusion by the F plasmid [uncultured Candidatus Thioglobus sp.]|nr:Protein affecting phage T7 exclusion by the F plasmid [uncultured Candidatus Thioglobus sp.]
MLFPIFVIATLSEIYVLVAVGDSIGAGNTILLVIATAFIGSYLLKQQGFSTLKKVQSAAAQGKNPSFEMLEGVVIMVSGILLLTPGFITDFIGLLGLMPWSRAYFLTSFLQKNTDKIFTSAQFQKSSDDSKWNNSMNDTPQDSNTIDGEFWEEDKNKLDK